ncbi:hypothetical protein B7486_46490 [cyanobacterium TDX16]|nr:hypothetical protein B7486_46490 [cyanobacterium TDX16]
MLWASAQIIGRLRLRVKLMNFLSKTETCPASRSCPRQRHADKMLLLSQLQIDRLLASQLRLQAFLTWLSQKSDAVASVSKGVTVRAFYFDLALARILGRVGSSLDLALSFNPTLTCNLEPNLALDLLLDRVLGLNQVIATIGAPSLACQQVLERAMYRARPLEPLLELALLQLKRQLPEPTLNPQRFRQWWSASGGIWIEQLTAVAIEHRNLGHDW